MNNLKKDIDFIKFIYTINKLNKTKAPDILIKQYRANYWKQFRLMPVYYYDKENKQQKFKIVSIRYEN